MPNQKPITGTALVTGGAKRIGAAIALGLARRGLNVAVHYNRSRKEAETIAGEIESLGVTCKAFQCNLSNEAEVLSLMKDVKGKFPDLNLLINNASIFKKSQLTSGSLDSLHEHFNTNFIAPYILSCCFAETCKQGHIINILDTHIAQSKTGHCAYLLSKKALAELTKMSAAVFAPEIRANGVAPGLILPPAGSENVHLDRLAKDIPMQTTGNPSQIVEAINFLIDNEYITGQIIFNDGGEHLL